MEDERVGHQQRSQVLELLGAAAEQGYVMPDEYDERSTAASTAKTVSVLRAQIADLPAQFRWDPNPGGGGRSQPPADAEDERVGHEQRSLVVELLNAAVEQGYVMPDEYAERSAAASTAKTVSVLLAQVADLPAQFRWNPYPARKQPGGGEGRRPRTDEEIKKSANAALGLGLASILLSLCFIGWMFGIAAIVKSRKGDGQSEATIGRVFGIIGTIMSVGFIIYYNLHIRR